MPDGRLDDKLWRRLQIPLWGVAFGMMMQCTTPTASTSSTSPVQTGTILSQAQSLAHASQNPLQSATQHPRSLGDVLKFEPARAEQILTHAKMFQTYVLIKLWSTWCAPCIRELPKNIALAKRHREGEVLKVMLVSTDAPPQWPAAKDILLKHQADFRTWVKDEPDSVFIENLYSNWSGSLPASLLLDPQGKVVYFHEGEGQDAQLSRWLQTLQ